MSGVSLPLWFAKTRLVIYLFTTYRGVNAAHLREPHGGWCVVLEVKRPWERPMLLAEVLGFGRSSPCVATASPMGMRGLNHCTSSLTCCLNYYRDQNRCIFLGMLRLRLAPGIPFGCPGMRVSDDGL